MNALLRVVAGSLAALTLSSCVYWTPLSRRTSNAATVIPNVPMQVWDIKSCGAGSLSSLLQHYGDPTTMQEWDAALPKTRGGVMSIDLVLAARQKGFDSRLVTGDQMMIERELLDGRPLILMLQVIQAPGRGYDFFHYVVLDGIDPQRNLFRTQFGDGKARWVKFKRIELAWKRAGYAAILVRPKDPASEALRAAVSLEEKGQYADAAREYRAILNAHPASVVAWTNLGNAETRNQNPNAAEQAFRKAISLDANAADALNNLAWLLYEQKRLEEAETFARRAVQAPAPDPWMRLDTLARIQLERGECSDALKTWDKAIEEAPASRTTERAEMQREIARLAGTAAHRIGAMFSRRAHWSTPLNRLTKARQSRVLRGEALLDLTVSNPTRAGIHYPEDELSAAFARGAREPYDPQPLGISSARQTVAEHLHCEATDVVITASTSEAYSFLFKLLAQPGDSIVTAVPSYPLFEHLAQLELIRLKTFPLEFHRRWEMNPAPVEAAIDSTTRAIVVVSPNNPTGSFVTEAELEILARHGLPIILDEVFSEYRHESTSQNPACPPEVLSFSLGGLSKSAGLPHLKLGWIRIGGPEDLRREAIEGLELIADNFLSVSTPVQVALPELMRLGNEIRAAIHDRTRTNLAFLRERLRKVRAVEGLPVEGGWSAVLRVPRTDTDEDFALRLLDRGVLVQPGYFFDFASDGYLVVSLLTPVDDFQRGIDIVIDEVTR